MTPFAPCEGCPYNDEGYCDLWDRPVSTIVDCDLPEKAEVTD